MTLIEGTQRQTTYIGFLYQGSDRAVDDIARQLVADLREGFVGHAASGQWRLYWSPAREGIELVIGVYSDLLTDDSNDELGNLVLSHQEPVRQLIDLEVMDFMERYAGADECRRTRVL